MGDVIYCKHSVVETKLSLHPPNTVTPWLGLSLHSPSPCSRLSAGAGL